jgi:hypothetical protein
MVLGLIEVRGWVPIDSLGHVIHTRIDTLRSHLVSWQFRLEGPFLTLVFRLRHLSQLL